MTLTLNREQLQFFSHSSRWLQVGTLRQAGDLDEWPTILTVQDEADLARDMIFTRRSHTDPEGLELARVCLKGDHPGVAFLALIYLSQRGTEAEFQEAVQVFTDRRHIRPWAD